MAKTLQFKRYTTSVLANTTGSIGELIVDTNTSTITVHDGITAGGRYTANAIMLQVAFNQANAAYALANADLAYITSNVALILGIDSTQNNTINLAFTRANVSFTQANLAYTQANLAYTQANSASITSSNANANAITSGVYANSAFAAANAAATIVPQNPQTTNYVLQLSDAGKHIYYTQASNTTLYIPTSSNVAFSNGTTIMIVSKTTSGANVTVSPNTGVSLFLAGNTTSDSRNVTTYGMATLIQVAANTWFIQGTGIL
jgi:hypothetical protein